VAWPPPFTDSENQGIVLNGAETLGAASTREYLPAMSPPRSSER